jgi:hypothetical protein
MKIAGQKNDGAWFRINRWIKKTIGGNGNAAVAQGLVAAIQALDTYAPYVAALNAIMAKVGLPALTTDDLATHWMQSGIPREVWMGKFTFDTYTKGTDSHGKTVYTPDNAVAALKFANDLRPLLIKAKMGLRIYNDVRNLVTIRQGNPGGIADDTQGN